MDIFGWQNVTEVFDATVGLGLGQFYNSNEIGSFG